MDTSSRKERIVAKRRQQLISLIIDKGNFFNIDDYADFFYKTVNDITEDLHSLNIEPDVLPINSNKCFLEHLKEERYNRYIQFLKTGSNPTHFLYKNGIEEEPVYDKPSNGVNDIFALIQMNAIHTKAMKTLLDKYDYGSVNKFLKEHKKPETVIEERKDGILPIGEPVTIDALYKKGMTSAVIAHELGYSKETIDKYLSRQRNTIKIQHDYPDVSEQERQEILDLISKGHSIKDVSLKTGVIDRTVTKIVHEEYKGQDSINKGDYKHVDRREKIADYLINGKLSQGEIALKMNLDRKTVISDIQKYCYENPDKAESIKKAILRNRSNKKRNDSSEITYLIKECYEIRKQNPEYTVTKIASTLGISNREKAARYL